MPEMTLEYALKRNGIDIKDLTIDTSIAFSAMSGAFLSGDSDFVTLFEPQATELEQQEKGYVVASVGKLGGIVPYTAFNARKTYLENNKELIENFKKALQKGLDYVETHNDYEVAKVISKQFPDTSLKTLEKVIKRYRSINAWPKNTDFKKESFDHLQDIMKDAKQLKKKVDYNDLIYKKNQ